MMKRLNMIALALLLAAATLWAVPAHRGATIVTQPDGTTVTLRLHGDEWLNYSTTVDGYSVVKNSAGYYVYAQLQGGRLTATSQVAHDAAGRDAREQSFVAALAKHQVPQMTAERTRMKQLVEQREAQKRQRLAASRQGNRAAHYDYSNFKGLLILIEFTDQKFSRSDYKDIITDMVNQEGYTGFNNSYGQKQTYTGSVRDYFSDNSMGKFVPEFDVYGPYTADFTKDKGGNQSAAILADVVNKADADINFADYDRDGDGFVDMIFFMVAGYGANYSGNDGSLWWPHRSVVHDNGNYIVKDDVYLADYASSTEMYGWKSGDHCIDGIGTICHEFSHVLGLPDFYDTDYAQSGGESNHPGEWSVMAGGSYYNRGRTPVGYSLYERWDVGFTDSDPVTIDAEGSYTLDPLYTSNTGYRINSSVANEYFLFENRQKNAFKWDANLPGSGMLVHRVDKTNESVWSMTSWNGNTVNANPAHNYYEVIRADGPKQSYGEWIAAGSDLFPGTRNVRRLDSTTSPASLKSWSGEDTKWGLENITMTDGVVTFDIANTFVLSALSLPATFSVGQGVSQQLLLTATPASAEYTVTWTSSDESVATVNEQGFVTGVSVGTCTITATADNGLTATCEVTVEALEALSLTDFCQLEAGTEALLQLNNAEVLYTQGTTVFVREPERCLMLTGVDLGVQRNDVVSGTLFVRFDQPNNMPQAVGISGTTTADNLTIVAGSEVQPREVDPATLTAADYGDYVLLRGVQLMRLNGVWVVTSKGRMLLADPFGEGSVPSRLTNKYFDVEAIFGTDVHNLQTVDAFYRLKVTETSDPTAIRTVSTPQADSAAAPCYNLQGQRVGAAARGLLIRNGKKHIVK